MNINNPSSRKQKTKQSILEAAAYQFKNLGYVRTSTQSIANKANVSEMTLFRHFGSKENIFKAVLEKYSGMPQIELFFRKQLPGNFESDLKKIGSMFLKIVTERQKYIQLILCEAQHFPELGETIKEMPYKLHTELANYFEEQIKMKKIRDVDPFIMANAFWGMFFAYGVYFGLSNKKAKPISSQDELVSQFIDIFINGVSTNIRESTI